MKYMPAYMHPEYGLFIIALVLVSGLVFLLAMLGNTPYKSFKHLLYALFVICWTVAFIYLVVRVGAMVYVAIGRWVQ
jgi:hypothetical protein